jgi:hypothetical protein
MRMAGRTPCARPPAHPPQASGRRREASVVQGGRTKVGHRRVRHPPLATRPVIRSARPAAAPVGGDPGTPRPPPLSAGYNRPKYVAWASLLERTFAIDVLACPDCGGRLRFIATIEDREVIEKILRHLEVPLDPPVPAPARRADWLPGVDPVIDGVRA